MQFNRIRRNAPVQGIVFDCDGTLLDSMPAWQGMENELARRCGMKLTDRQIDQLNANTLSETARFFHEEGGLGPSVAAVEADALSILTSCYMTRVQPKPGALEFLEAMAVHGVRMSVASSSPHELLAAGLNKAGITPYLQAIVSVTDTGKSKRNPATLNAAFRALGVPRSKTWGFEDSLYAVGILRQQGFCAMGIYDSDAAGTYRDLLNAANHAVHSFREIGVEAFLEGRYR